MKILKKIYWWIFIVILSMRWILRVNLGSEISYKSKKYIVVNGDMPDHWKINNDNREYVESKECMLIYSFKNFIWNFSSGYRFYMGNWYRIWVENGLEDWMKGCNIW